jgi:hypothetical protein
VLLLLCPSQFQLTGLTTNAEYQPSFDVIFKFKEVISMKRL